MKQKLEVQRGETQCGNVSDPKVKLGTTQTPQKSPEICFHSDSQTYLTLLSI